jgi:hypothetical protein
MYVYVYNIFSFVLAVSQTPNTDVGLASPCVGTAKTTDRRGQPLLSSTDLNVTQPREDKTKLSHAIRYSGLTKPPFTYTELIEEALQEKGELTVSEIYQWIA